MSKTQQTAALANTRETAKRFLRLVTSSHSTPSSGRPSSPNPAHSADISLGLGEEGMAFGDGARFGHHRGNSNGGPVGGTAHRPSIADSVRTDSGVSTRSNDSTTSLPDIIGDEKPIATGNGIAVSIALAEPILFLQGFDQSELANQTTTMLRGSLHLKVTKTAKIKTVTLKFRGRSETEWPEGIPPKKTDFKDTESFMDHTWPFFNAQFQTAEHSHGADHVQLTKCANSSTKDLGVTGANMTSFDHFQRSSTPTRGNLTTKEAKRLSLQLNQSRSFGKGDSANGGSTVAQKGYKTFNPGDYIYNFELALDSRLPESIAVDLGSVKYELEALVERSGAFRANLLGTKEVTLIRAPGEGSLEHVEPIAISRTWEDQLHYDIVISGKSFPLGAQVPIAFKLTPLAKVQCHRIKVYLTENIQYFTNDKRVHRIEPTKKLQLFEKRADGPSVSTYPGSSVRITAGGGVDYDSREAAARGEENVDRDMTNLLGNLSGEQNIGPTEMEFNVQLPSCHQMKEKEKWHRIHFDTTYSNIQVNHWIKIVMRLSKPDTTDSTKRRHFEISIDSPFHILSCRATQANTALPAYSSPDSTLLETDRPECGCPGALRRKNSPNSHLIPTLSGLRNGTNTPTNSSTPNLVRTTNNNENDPLPPSASRLAASSASASASAAARLTRPQAAHIHDPNSGPVRPIHILRNPSFNPPAFEDEAPPPPLLTPPPQYDAVVGGDHRSALADYFSRLADDIGDGDEELERGSGRVDLPLTPGGRVNRSMDVRRTWVPIGGGVGVGDGVVR